MGSKSVWSCASFVAGSLVAASLANANGYYSPIGKPYPGEATTKDILNHTYDQSFHQVTGTKDYSGSDYYAERVYDWNLNTQTDVTTASPLNMGKGISAGGTSQGGNGTVGVTENSYTDQIWDGLGVSAVATAKFALFSQSFGAVPGYFGTAGYQNILDVSGSQYDVQGSGTLLNLFNFPFRFARTGDNGTFTSSQFDNPGFFDHMVTYQIFYTGDDSSRFTLNQYMLFFEDKNLTDVDSDYDYNDMAIQINVLSYNSDAVAPEPASMAVLGLGSAALLRRGRRAAK